MKGDQKGLADRLTVKKSAGVAQEVNLRTTLRAKKEARKQGINRGFETQGRCHQKFKTR